MGRIYKASNAEHAQQVRAALAKAAGMPYEITGEDGEKTTLENLVPEPRGAVLDMPSDADPYLGQSLQVKQGDQYVQVQIPRADELEQLEGEEDAGDDSADDAQRATEQTDEPARPNGDPSSDEERA